MVKNDGSNFEQGKPGGRGVAAASSEKSPGSPTPALIGSTNAKQDAAADPSRTASPGPPRLSQVETVPRPAASFPAPASGLHDEHQELIGRFQIQALLGEGRMGRVYRAYDPTAKSLVALKVIHWYDPPPEILRQFELEAQRLRAAAHPNTVVMHEFGKHQSRHGVVPYIVMEYAHGSKALSDPVLQRSLTRRQVVELIAQAAEAAHRAHSEAIFHSDLKPSNILVATVNDRPYAKVIDFGLARLMTGRAHASEVAGGSPAYAAPEFKARQYANPDAQSDIYALGMSLYELLCGETPGVAWYGDGADRGCPRPTSREPSIDAALEKIVLRAISAAPRDRPATAGELARELRDWLDSPWCMTKATVNRWCSHHPFAAAVQASLIAGVLAATVGGRIAVSSPWVSSWFDRAVQQGSPAPMIPQHTRLIVVNDTPKLWEAVGKLGITREDVQKSPTMFRRVYAQLAWKLNSAGARTIAFDLFFKKPPTPGVNDQYDEELGSALEALYDAGTDVVLAMDRWGWTKEEMMPLAPRLANSPKLLYAPATQSHLVDVPAAPLVVMRGESDPKPLMSLLTALVAQHPRHMPSFSLVSGDASDARLSVRFKTRNETNQLLENWSSVNMRMPAGVFQSPVPAGFVGQTSEGLSAGDRVCVLPIPRPSDEAWAPATYDLADVLAATDEDLSMWFHSKVLVVGDARQGPRGDPALDYAVGKPCIGYLFVAETIERLMQSRHLTVASDAGMVGIACAGASAGVMAVLLAGWSATAVAARRKTWLGTRTDEHQFQLRVRIGLQVLAVGATLGIAWFVVTAAYRQWDYLTYPAGVACGILFGGAMAARLPCGAKSKRSIA